MKLIQLGKSCTERSMHKSSRQILISDAHQFAHFVPLTSSEEEEESGSEESGPDPIMRDIGIDGMIYLKYLFDGRNTKSISMDSRLYTNIVDVFSLRKRLCNQKDAAEASYTSLMGVFVKEINNSEDAVIITSNFDSGNAFTVVKGEDGSYLVEMSADTNSYIPPRWFYFALRHCDKGKVLNIRIYNYGSMNAASRVIPVYKSKTDWKTNEEADPWKRIDYKQVKAYQNTRENTDEKIWSRAQGKYSLEWTFTVEHQRDTIWFAPSFPMGYEEEQQTIQEWHGLVKGKKDQFLKKRLLSYTLSGRKLHYYELYQSNDPQFKVAKMEGKLVIIVVARIQPYETASSLVLKGFVQGMFDKQYGHMGATFIRENFVVIIVPTLNYDGVTAGNTVSTLSGSTLANSFINPDRYLEPESYYLKRLIQNISKKNKICLLYELRSSENIFNSCLHGYESVNSKATVGQKTLHQLLNNSTAYYSIEDAKFLDVTTQKSLASMAWRRFGIRHSYQFIVSSLGANQRFQFTPADYIRIGKELCAVSAIFLGRQYEVGNVNIGIVLT